MRFTIIILLFVILGCDKKEKIVIDFKKEVKQISYSTIADSIDYINLETNNNCLLSRIDQFKNHNDYLFFLDKKQKSVFIFQNSGRYVNKINFVGRGPGEFIAITSFCLDRAREEVCIHDDMLQKIIRYKYDGTFLNEINYDRSTIIRSLAFVKEKYLCITPDYLSRTRDGIWAIDTLGNFIQEIKDIDSKYDFTYYPFPCYSSYTNESIRFYDWHTDEIYQFDSKLNCLYQFDCKQKMPMDYYTGDNPVFTKDGKFRGTGNYFTIDRYMSCNGIHFMEYSSNFKGKMFVLFRERDHKIMISRSFTNDIDRKGASNSVFNYSANQLAFILYCEQSNPQIQLLKMIQ